MQNSKPDLIISNSPDVVAQSGMPPGAVDPVPRLLSYISEASSIPFAKQRQYDMKQKNRLQTCCRQSLASGQIAPQATKLAGNRRFHRLDCDEKGRRKCRKKQIETNKCSGANPLYCETEKGENYEL